MKTFLVAMWSSIMWRGLSSLAFGVAAFIWPNDFIRVLTFLFGALVLLDGAWSIWTSYSNRSATNRAFPLATGLVELVIGGLAFFAPDTFALYLVYVLALWMIAMGLLQLLSAIVLRSDIENEIWVVLSGLVSLLLGLLVIGNKSIGVVSMAYLIGFSAVLVGIVLLLFGYQLYRLSKRLLTP